MATNLLLNTYSTFFKNQKIIYGAFLIKIYHKEYRDCNKEISLLLWYRIVTEIKIQTTTTPF